MADQPDQADRTDRVPAWVRRVSIASWAFLGFVGALTVVIVVGIALRDLIVPLVMAGFLAIVFAPLVDRLERWGVPRMIGAIVVIVAVGAVLVAAVTIVVIGVADRADELSVWFDRAQDEIADLLARWDLDGAIADFRNSADGSGSSLLEGLGDRVGNVLGSAVSLVSGLVLGVVLLYYLLKDGAELARAASARRTPEASDQTNRILAQAAHSIRAHFRGRTVLAAVQGIAVTLILWVMDVPLPGSIGAVNFIGAYIPYLGAFVGGAFAVVMALAGGGTTLALAALAVVLFVNLILENLLEPRLVGASLQMHPVVVLLATVAGGVMVGIVGLILAAPLTAIGLNLFRELRGSGFFGPVPDPNTTDDPAN